MASELPASAPPELEEPLPPELPLEELEAPLEDPLEEPPLPLPLPLDDEPLEDEPLEPELLPEGMPVLRVPPPLPQAVRTAKMAKATPVERTNHPGKADIRIVPDGQ